MPFRQRYETKQGGYIMPFGKFWGLHIFQSLIKGSWSWYKTCHENGSEKVNVTMDNQTALLPIQGSEPYGGDCTHIMHNWRHLVGNSNWKTTFFHCFRGGNRAADWLDNNSVNQGSKMEIMQIPPLELGRILHEDVIGMTLTRLVSTCFFFVFFCFWALPPFVPKRPKRNWM